MWFEGGPNDMNRQQRILQTSRNSVRGINEEILKKLGTEEFN